MDAKKTCTICCLCRLAGDLLEIIFSNLSVLDYVYFRAVCKCRRLAFNDCAAAASNNIISQQKPEREFPWCLILKADEKHSRDIYYGCPPTLRTTGKLGSLYPFIVYPTNMPELCGTQILLAKYGWLLLFSTAAADDDDQGKQKNKNNNSCSSLYFFNPFSKAKIELPFIDVDKLFGPVFGLSAPPTSADSMVFIASTRSDKSPLVKFHVCKRGESSWSSYRGGFSGEATHAVFAKGIWYCIHTSGALTAFEVVHHKYIDIYRVPGYDPCHRSRPISYPVKRGDEIFLRVHSDVCYEIELSSPHSLVAKEVEFFTDSENIDEMLNLQDCEFLIRTDLMKAVAAERRVMSLDSFNVDTWCAEFDANGAIMYLRWHRFTSQRSVAYGFPESHCCNLRNNCSTFVLWFEPVWVHPSPNLSWI